MEPIKRLIGNWMGPEGGQAIEETAAGMIFQVIIII